MTINLQNIQLLQAGAIPQQPFNSIVLNNVLPYWWSNAIPFSTKIIVCDGGAQQLQNYLASKTLDEVTLKKIYQRTSVVGDFDSLQESAIRQLKEGGANIHKLDQNSFGTDSENALNMLKSDDICFVFGASGRRMDHTLNNISLASRYGSNIILVDNKNMMSAIPKGMTTFQVKDIKNVGIFPLQGKTRCTTTGLSTNMEDEIIDFGDNVVCSQKPNANIFSVKVDMPSLVVMHYE